MSVLISLSSSLSALAAQYIHILAPVSRNRATTGFSQSTSPSQRGGEGTVLSGLDVDESIRTLHFTHRKSNFAESSRQKPESFLQESGHHPRL